MKLAVMQPYIFPYIGYFQLMSAVDHFVLFDDVQFIKKGWINRNRILNGASSFLFTVPLVKASQQTLIKDRMINVEQWEINRAKLLTFIQRNYHAAPFFTSVFPEIESMIKIDEPCLVEYIEHSLRVCCELMGINIKITKASNLNIPTELKGQDRIVNICKKLGASQYINAIGGKNLYDQATFHREGIKLLFIQAEQIKYVQFGNEFVPWLSIIDVLMFNSMGKVREYLARYSLV